jgi:serpin B
MRHTAPLLFAITLLGCPGPDPDQDDPNRVARVVTNADGDIGVMVSGHNDFSWELYAQLREEADEGNVFFSPFSVTSALGMTLAGAQGATETEMAAALHVTGEEAAWHSALGALTRDLNGDLHRGYTLHIANRLFGQEGYPFEADFLAICADDYGAPLEEWDFISDPEGGRQRVNAWVEEQTQDRIVDLLPEGSVNDGTRLVLANAIYFLADWATAFDPDDTGDTTFTRLDGSTVTVPMMNMNLEDLEEHGVETGWTAEAGVLRMPYKDDEVSMVVLVPHEVDGLPDLEASLDASLWAEALGSLGVGDAPIGLPRLEIDYKTNLIPHLQALGVEAAFDSGAADFTGIATPPEDGNLYITGAFHQAFVKVDEAGTEAAAATGVVVGNDSAPMPIIADRPFLFVIQDDLTGAVLFIGRVTDPS